MPLPDEQAEETLRNEALRSILKSLSHRERRVLELRYGLDGEQPRTLDEVGKAFNVTRERIRQIENQGLKKLRRALAAQLRDVASGSPHPARPRHDNRTCQGLSLTTTVVRHRRLSGQSLVSGVVAAPAAASD